MKNLDDLINEEVESKIETPFVTAKFGNNWREHAKDYDTDTLIRIAWEQGRKSILLERLLRKLYERGDKFKVVSTDELSNEEQN